ncbi:MAG TPA: histidine phosphatase family protein [Gemmatimonadota bacterium]|nr:histidine phosphatase family protein [Gemmatimonadota bacterium]
MAADPVASAVPADATRFLLVRHGETDYNAEGRWQGCRSDPPLNARGHAQAEAIADVLTGRRVEALYTSPQRRARETAALLSRRLVLEPLVIEDLREMDHGEWEGKTKAEILARWAREFEAFEADPLHVRRPGGDSYEDLAARVWPTLERLADHHRGETIALVTHGGPVRLILSRVLDRPLTERGEFGVDNASVFTVEESSGQWLGG